MVTMCWGAGSRPRAGVLYTLMTKVYWVMEEATHSQRSNHLHHADQLQLSQNRSRWARHRRAESIMGKTVAEEQADVLGCMILNRVRITCVCWGMFRKLLSRDPMLTNLLGAVEPGEEYAEGEKQNRNVFFYHPIQCLQNRLVKTNQI